MLTALFSILPDVPGLALCTVAFAVAYRALRFPDLTLEGSFLAGTAAAGAMAASGSLLGGLLLAICLGAAAGCTTAGVYRLNPRPSFKMLSGIFVTFIFYSVNFLVLDSKVEASFADAPTLFNKIAQWEADQGFGMRPLTVATGAVMLAVVLLVITLILRSRFGCKLRFACQRPALVRPATALLALTAGLALTNSIAAIGGFWCASVAGYASLGSGGWIIHALAGCILGELLAERFGKDRRVSLLTLVVFPAIGACLYAVMRAAVTWAFVDLLSDSALAINQHHQNSLVAVLLTGGLMVARYLSQRGTHARTSIEYVEDDV